MAARDFFRSGLEPLPAATAASAGIDELLASYARWREEAHAVTQAYGEWSQASSSERPRRHAAYLAALDQEAAAGDDYGVMADEFRPSPWPTG
jgi:hypothetical protein